MQQDFYPATIRRALNRGDNFWSNADPFLKDQLEYYLDQKVDTVTTPTFTFDRAPSDRPAITSTTTSPTPDRVLNTNQLQDGAVNGIVDDYNNDISNNEYYYDNYYYNYGDDYYNSEYPDYYEYYNYDYSASPEQTTADGKLPFEPSAPLHNQNRPQISEPNKRPVLPPKRPNVPTFDKILTKVKKKAVEINSSKTPNFQVLIINF